MIYNLNGIPSSEPPQNKFWIAFNGFDYVLSEKDLTHEIEKKCLELDSKIIAKLFGSLESYYAILPTVSMIYSGGGIDAEVKISKEDFEKLVVSLKNDKLSNTLLFFYDFRNVMATVQNGVLECKLLLGLFYKTLNENSFLVAPEPVIDDGIAYSSGAIVTNITTIVNQVFINLYSLLDFVTKLIYECQNLPIDFNTYPRLSCQKILYGDFKKLQIKNYSKTLYEKCETINRIISLRNEVVHNSSIDGMPKVYQVIKDKKIIEKFILIPDSTDGIIKTSRNRKRFFDDELKLNELLPDVIFDFWQRILNTFDNLL